MIAFFSHAADAHELQGSRAYLENIRGLFAQEERSGMIEVDLGPDERQVYLYWNGQVIAAYTLSGDTRFALDPEMDEIAGTEILPVRYVNLPDQAVRAAWQALEWYPPQRGAHLDAADLTPYLDALRVQGTRGQLHIVLPDLDGFLFLSDGQPVSGETVLVSSRGFLESLPNLNVPGGRLPGTCDVWLTELRPGSPASELVELRVAFCAWVNAWLSEYRQVVGHNLMLQLNPSTNIWLRQRRQNLHLAGLTLVDHHLFLQPELARLAYRSLAAFLTEQMAQVIGDQLVARAANTAYKQLKVSYQKTLEQHECGPLLASGGK